ncbi:MAG: PKD domain-containing protein [Thermoanaerobaculia bacterium]
MGAIRATAAAVLILFTAVAAIGDCVTTTRLISTRQSQPNLVNGPVAWSGSVLGVAKTQEGVATAVWFAVYGEDLQTLVGDRLVANDSRDLVALEWTGTEFGLFYRTQNQRLHLQRLTMMGDPIGGPIAITPSRTVYAGDEIDVEWSPVFDAYVVARDISQGQHKGIWVTFVEREGTHRTDRKLPVFAAAQSNLSLSVTDSGIVGVFFQNLNGTLSFARMTETSIPISNAVSQTPGNYIETAAQGNLFIVVHSVANGPKTEIRWIVVDTSHQILRPDELLLEGSGDDVWPLALIATEDELALAYLSTEDRDEPINTSYRLRRFTIDGTTITDTNFAAAGAGAVTRAESEHDFVWTGTSYLQAAVRESQSLLNSHLQRYCPLRVDIATDVAYGRPGQPVVFTALPDGGVPSYTYAWTFGDPQRVFRTQSVARTYEDIGTYTATLTVTDTAGAVVTTTYTVNVVNVKRRSTRH